jgi:hypothetical protein
MAVWKKVIVSGSVAELSAVSASAFYVQDGQLITTSPASTILSGSFSGSFQGDGSDLTGIVSSLHISASTAGGILSSGSIDLKTETLKINGTANEIDTEYNDATNTLTIGLPDSVNITTDLTVGGDLTVNGDLTYLNVANLAVEDKFILLNSGSSNPDEAGLVVDEGSGVGHAFAFDSDTTRWGFTASLDSATGSFVPDAFAAAVVTSDIVEYQKTGNIRVESGEIYIWV